MMSRWLVVLGLVSAIAAPAAAAPPRPDAPPGAHHKATVSGSYWVDVNVYVADQLVHGAKGRCLYRVHYARSCFIIRTDVR